SRLELDRRSCPRFLANQFRVLLTLDAYILFQELQRRAARAACAGAQVTLLRERLIKLAVWVQRSARRIVLHLPLSFPWGDDARLPHDLSFRPLAGRPHGTTDWHHDRRPWNVSGFCKALGSAGSGA